MGNCLLGASATTERIICHGFIRKSYLMCYMWVGCFCKASQHEKHNNLIISLKSRPADIWTETIPGRLELKLISALWLDAQCWKQLSSSSSNHLIVYNTGCQKSHIICTTGMNNFNAGLFGRVDKDWALEAPIYLPKAPIYWLLRDGHFLPSSCCDITWIMWMTIIINKRMMTMVVLNPC